MTSMFYRLFLKYILSVMSQADSLSYTVLPMIALNRAQFKKEVQFTCKNF